jgi:YHS domain-containing protein
MSFDTLVNIVILAVALLLMVRFGCGRHMLGQAHGRADVGAHGASGVPPTGASRATPQDVDPVCGMTVDKSTALAATLEGRTYYFCSLSCRQRFEASPDAYVAKAGAVAQPVGRRHGCC